MALLTSRICSKWWPRRRDVRWFVVYGLSKTLLTRARSSSSILNSFSPSLFPDADPALRPRAPSADHAKQSPSCKWSRGAWYPMLSARTLSLHLLFDFLSIPCLCNSSNCSLLKMLLLIAHIFLSYLHCVIYIYIYIYVCARMYVCTYTMRVYCYSTLSLWIRPTMSSHDLPYGLTWDSIPKTAMLQNPEFLAMMTDPSNIQQGIEYVEGEPRYY